MPFVSANEEDLAGDVDLTTCEVSWRPSHTGNGFEVLLVNGYPFQRHMLMNSGVQTWRCAARSLRCPVRASTIDKKLVKLTSKEHTHPVYSTKRTSLDSSDPPRAPKRVISKIDLSSPNGSSAMKPMITVTTPPTASVTKVNPVHNTRSTNQTVASAKKILQKSKITYALNSSNGTVKRAPSTSVSVSKQIEPSAVKTVTSVSNGTPFSQTGFKRITNTYVINPVTSSSPSSSNLTVTPVPVLTIDKKVLVPINCDGQIMRDKPNPEMSLYVEQLQSEMTRLNNILNDNVTELAKFKRICSDKTSELIALRKTLAAQTVMISERDAKLVNYEKLKCPNGLQAVVDIADDAADEPGNQNGDDAL
ncbi:hypothetical protein HDE_07924 [Halotydeus destructor]|nr:hypothetical protein HDE_07924 [Halotydeus destructor]